MKNERKKKILVIADSPMAPSGVGTQTKYMIESLLETGKYSFLCLAGAVKHADYRTKHVEPYGRDWLIKPVDGYGNEATIRSLLLEYRPDVLWFMTDPRFYVWLWSMESEIRTMVPMVYYHVWDNYPYPEFNKVYYESNDLVCTISKVTDDIVRTVAPEVKTIRIPHTVDTNIFKKIEKDPGILNIRREILKGKDPNNALIFFWNNRNARRKHPGTLIYWFKEFLDRVGHEKAVLLMHTEPRDPQGPNLLAIVEKLKLEDNQVMFSREKLSPTNLAALYNAADCTINISDAEGFGLGTLESLATETPIIVNLTGGLQEQVTDGVSWFGLGIEPCSKAVIGSQDVPYIYEDRINKEDFIQSLTKFLLMTPEERKLLGTLGRAHVLANYGFEKYGENWKNAIEAVINDFGSWEERKGYTSWEFKEII